MDNTINIKKWFDVDGNIDMKYLILLVLAVLHKENKISNAKLKGQFMSLRKGTLDKRKNVYHCDINDKWYNDDPTNEIWSDLLSMTSGYISLKDFIQYIKKYFNCNLNYALNIFGSQYLYRLYARWNPEWHSLSFSDYIDFNISGIIAKKISHYCHCCGHDRYEIEKNTYTDIKTMNDWIHNRKKGNLKKIPYFEVNTHSGLWM